MASSFLAIGQRIGEALRGRSSRVGISNTPPEPPRVVTLETDTCPVCFDETHLDRLPCGHSVCETCLRRIANSPGYNAEAGYTIPQRGCPICRGPIPNSYRDAPQPQPQINYARFFGDGFDDYVEEQRQGGGAEDLSAQLDRLATGTYSEDVWVFDDS